MPEIKFIGGAYQGLSPNVNAQECINLYPEVDKEGGKVLSLFPVPGLKVWLNLDLDDNPTRGFHLMDGHLYAVIGNTVYRIKPDRSFLAMTGVIGTNSGQIFMAHNSNSELMIVDVAGGKGYILAGLVVTEIADVDFVTPSGLAWQDGYFIVTEANTQRFWISALNDGTSWNALEYATAEGLPDDLVAIISDHRELWMFGNQSTEVFYNSGAVDFPFIRIQGSFQNNGIGAAASLSQLDNTLFWLDNWGVVRRANGYVPVIVSTPQIAYQIGQYDIISDAIAFSYVHEGHSFYVLTFPSADRTWVYDVATGFWHRRSSFPNDPEGRWRANCYALFANTHLVGDFQHGKIYELDHKTFTDDGKTIKAVRTAQAIDASGKIIFFNEFELKIQAGVGTAVGAGSDPQLMLQWSDDGAKTWSNEHWRSMGQIGEYTKRVRWQRLGRAYDRIFKVMITDPVNRIIISAYLDAELGTH